MSTRGSAAWRAEHWGEPGGFKPVRVVVYEGAPACQVHPLMVPACHQLGRVFLAFGYPVTNIGGYNKRKLTGSDTVWSSHAYGISLDVNPGANPYRRDRLVTDMPREMIEVIENGIRTIDGVHVFRWGGDWDGRPNTPHSNYDAMHFEGMATPAELARGFAATILGPLSDVARPVGRVPTRAFPILKRGDVGDAVALFQDLVQLERLGNGRGKFGPRTEDAARRYQRSRGLIVDGVVGTATWTALVTNQPELALGVPTPQKLLRLPVHDLA